jgi:hydrogenase expression/formation protein HypD
MDIAAGNWRGIGAIPDSAYVLKPAYAAHDSRVQLPSYTEMARKRAGEMPPGCDCAKVVLGKIYPNECRLYGLACTPRQPVGPCMVSDEGACRIWWANGVRENVWAGRKASGAEA